MVVTMRVEQTPRFEKRIKYIPEYDEFIETDRTSLMYYRGFDGVYGWIEGYGTPPKEHMDIYVITQRQLSLGDRLNARIIGCFLREDGDNKIIAVDEARKEQDINDLDDKDLSMVLGLYPRVGENDGWFGRSKAIELIESFDKTRTYRTSITL